MSETIENVFGGRTRVRVCGLILNTDGILLVRHTMGPKGELWIPPGGEVHFKEPLKAALKREILEETGLEVEVGGFAFGFEFIAEPFHAIELFFHITSWEGKVMLGSDPELESSQLISEVGFVTFRQLNVMDNECKHGIFSRVKSVEDLSALTGFIESNASK